MGNSASLSSLPYTIGEELEDASRPGSYGWVIHSGKRKSDGMPVCVFKGNKPKMIQTPVSRFFQAGGSSITIGKDRVDPNCLLIPAFRHFSKSKTLVHPSLLKVYATLDTDAPADTSAPPSGGVPSSVYANSGTAGDLIIVTERVIPLRKWITEHASDDKKGDKIAWGLVGIIQALGFLHANAKMSHCSLSPESIFVTPAGDFKLGNFSLLQHIGDGPGSNDGDSDYFRTYEAHLCPQPYRCPERLSGDYSSLLTSFPSHVMDSYSLGQLVEDLYTDVGMSVPEKLVKAVGRLKTPKTQQRPRVPPLLRCPVLDTPYVKSMEFLSDIAVKPAEEKISYLQSVPDQLNRNILTREALKYKLLPSVLRGLQNIAGNPAAIGQDVNRREVMAVIPVIFILAETLNEDEFQSQVTPLISVLFQLNDRGIRAALLQRLDSFTGRLDKNAINSTVFEPMCTGFTDSSGALRELTLKSTIPLIPHLNSVNLEKLGRYLVRLQSDTENSIRTNTVIFISKIAPSLAKNSRHKLLLPAFVRALKDPFPPCRLAALKSILLCREFFTPQTVAEQVLPCVVPHLVDPTSNVRKEAFSVMDQFLDVLKTESNRLEKVGDPNIDAVPNSTPNTTTAQPPGTTVPSAPTSAGPSYLSGLTSWMSSQAKASDEVQQTVAPLSAPTNLQQFADTPMMNSSPPVASANELTTPVTEVSQIGTQFGAMDITENDDGGGWSDDDDLITNNIMNNKPKPTPSGLSLGKSIMETTSSNAEDFFSSSMVGTRKHAGLGGGFGASAGANRPLAGAGKLMIPPSKSKLSLAERKAEFAKKKAEREALQQRNNGTASKLADDLTDGWEDF